MPKPAVERLALSRPADELIQTEVFQGEIAGVCSFLVSVPPNAIYCEPGLAGEDRVYLILSGEGTSSAAEIENRLEPQMMAHFPVGKPVKIKGSGKEGLTFLVLHLSLTPDDLADLSTFDERCRLPYLKKFSEGDRYAEKIKSPQTISRTLLPEGIVPRMAIGTVESRGPDAVALHCHTMLEQYFLGLEGNSITVITDEMKTPFGFGELLHIPLGSTHGAEVAEGCRLHYLWMDFFLNRQGQDWLKEHKPLE